MLHAAALSRHALEQQQSREPSKKQRSTLTAALKDVFLPTPAPFSYNTTPHLQPLRDSQGAPGMDIEGGSARADPSNKFSTIIPDYASPQEPNNEPRACGVYHRRLKVTRRRKRLGCFSCTRRLSTSSDGDVYSRPADLPGSTRYDTTESPKLVLPNFDYDDSGLELIVRRPITPTLPPKAGLAKSVSGNPPSLKHPQPQPGWVVMPEIPRESLISPEIGQSPQFQANDMEGDTGTDAYSLKLTSPVICTRYSGRVSTENAGLYSQTRANSDTNWRGQQETLNLGMISAPEAVSPPKTKRPGRTGIPLSELGGPHPRECGNLISRQCMLAENAPLQTAYRADSNHHPLHLVPKESVYQKGLTLCSGCDTKSKCDKVTGLCKRCELYLVSCLKWTPENMIQTPRTMVYHPQEVVQNQSTCGQRSDSPTLGQSATHLRISQPGAEGKGKVALYVDHVIPPKSHFSNTTIATFSCPSSPKSETDLSPFHYDNSGVPSKEIQELCNYWNGDTESSATSGSRNYTTDRPREQVLLQPAPKAKGYIKCFNRPPSPMRLAESGPNSRPGNLTLPPLNPRQRSQQGAISGIYQHAKNQDVIGSWINFSDRDSGSEEGQQDAINRASLEEGGSRLSRPISSIYSLYLKTE